MKLASVASLEGLVRLSVARLKAGARSTHRLVAALARGDGRTDHWAAAVLFAMLVVLVAFTFRDYAISNDEEVRTFRLSVPEPGNTGPPSTSLS